MSTEHATVQLPDGWSFASLAASLPTDRDNPATLTYDRQDRSIGLRVGALYVKLSVGQWDALINAICGLIADDMPAVSA